MQPTHADKQKSMRAIALTQSQAKPDEGFIGEGFSEGERKMDLSTVYELEGQIYYLSNLIESFQSILDGIKNNHDLDEIDGGDEILEHITASEAQVQEMTKPLIAVSEILQNAEIEGEGE